MLPNILTTVRLVLVPIFAYLMVFERNLYFSAVIFFLSGVTDVVDGYIARHYNMITNFGKVYDPFVDKLMQMTAVICLVILDIIPIWLLLIVLAKELTMIITGGILYLNKIVVSSNWYGKASTVIFYGAVLTMIVWRDMPEIASNIVFLVMICAMIFSAVGYVVDTIKNYSSKRVNNL